MSRNEEFYKALREPPSEEFLSPSRREEYKHYAEILINFFKDALNPEPNLNKEYQNHPVQLRLLQNPSAPWVIGAGKIIERFGENSFGEELSNRLRDYNQFKSAFLEVNIAYQIDKRGIQVEFSEKDHRNGKIFDLLVEGELGLEITRLREPEHVEIQKEYLSKITQEAIGIKAAGRIYRELSKPEAESINKEIAKNIKRDSEGFHLKKSEPIEISCESIQRDYSFLLCPAEKSDFYEDWKRKHGLEAATFLGPPVTASPLIRLKNKINAKAEKFSKENPGALFIKRDFEFPRPGTGMIDVIWRIQQDVYNLDELFALILEFPKLPIREENIENKCRNIRIGNNLKTAVIYNKFVKPDDRKMKLIKDIFF